MKFHTLIPPVEKRILLELVVVDFSGRLVETIRESLEENAHLG